MSKTFEHFDAALLVVTLLLSIPTMQGDQIQNSVATASVLCTLYSIWILSAMVYAHKDDLIKKAKKIQ